MKNKSFTVQIGGEALPTTGDAMKEGDAWRTFFRATRTTTGRVSLMCNGRLLATLMCEQEAAQ